MELRLKIRVILRCKLAMYNECQCQDCHVVCFEVSQLCFCQILFELVYSRKSYHKKGELIC